MGIIVNSKRLDNDTIPVQTTGTSTTDIMSQNASTTLLALKSHTHTMDDVNPRTYDLVWHYTSGIPTPYPNGLDKIYINGIIFGVSNDSASSIISTDNGETWIVKNFVNSSGTSNARICINDPTNEVFASYNMSSTNLYVEKFNFQSMSWESVSTQSSFGPAVGIKSKGNMLLVVTSWGKTYTSTDNGANWTYTSGVAPSSSIHSSGEQYLFIANNKFILKRLWENGSGSTVPYVSDDGLVWTMLPANIQQRVVYFNGKYITFFRDNNREINISDDLTTWTPYSLNLPSGAPNSLVSNIEVFDNNLFVNIQTSLGQTNGICYYSDDYASLFKASNIGVNNSVYFSTSNGKLFATGTGVFAYCNSMYSPASVLISDGGTGANNLVDAKTNLEIPNIVQSSGTSIINVMSQNATTNELNLKADLASPSFTGIPIAPTAATNIETNQIATTQYVYNRIPKLSRSTVSTNSAIVSSGQLNVQKYGVIVICLGCLKLTGNPISEENVGTLENDYLPWNVIGNTYMSCTIFKQNSNSGGIAFPLVIALNSNKITFGTGNITGLDNTYYAYFNSSWTTVS